MNNFVNSPQGKGYTVLPETRIYVKQIHRLVGILGGSAVAFAFQLPWSQRKKRRGRH
jgi:hypothetical protein